MPNRFLHFAAACALAAFATSTSLASGGKVPEPPPVPQGDVASLDPLADKSLLISATTAGKRLVVVGEYGHVLLSDDEGATWRQAQSVPTRVTLTSVSFADDKTGYAVGHDTIILKTTDGGENWTKLYGGMDSDDALLTVVALSPQEVIALGAFSFAIRTADAGANWEKFKLSEAAVPASPDAGSRAGTGSDEELGLSAEELEAMDEAARAGADPHLNRVFMAADGMLYVAAEFGTVFVSPDKGQSWTRVETGYEGSFWGGLALSDGGILVVGMRGNIWRSDDKGGTWSPLQSNSTESLSGALQLADGTIVIVGLGGAIVVSTDGGRTFTNRNRADRKNISDVAAGANGGIVVFGEAGVVHETVKPISS